MSDNEWIKALEASVAQTYKAYLNAKNCLDDYIKSTENNEYVSLNVASVVIENRIRGWAEEACEGSHCMGQDEYIQDFTVEGVPYRATMTFSYSRHDKTYYYIDEQNFKVEAL